MVTNDRPLTIRVDAAAQILGISRSSVYAMIAAGELPSVLIGRSRRVPYRQLEEWVEEHVVGLSGPSAPKGETHGPLPVLDARGDESERL